MMPSSNLRLDNLKQVKSYLFIVIVLLCSLGSKAQKLDSLYFNLYTDSLKKGTFNYINIDGRYSDGRWLPLTDKEINFSASAGKFHGNNLFLDSTVTDEKVVIKASLKSNPKVVREVTIFIKKYESNEQLKTVEEILNTPSKPGRKKKKSQLQAALHT